MYTYVLQIYHESIKKYTFPYQSTGVYDLLIVMCFYDLRINLMR